MHVEQVTADGFGPLSGETLELAPGLTVVWGPNEAGKSSWHAALLVALGGRRRGRGAATRSDRELVARHRPWDGGRWAVRATVVLDDGRRVELRHDLDGKVECRATDLTLGRDVTGEVLGDGAPDATRWVGLDRETMAATAWVPQAGVLALRGAAAGLQEQLARAAATGSGEVTASRALALLEEFSRERVGRDLPGSSRPLALARREHTGARRACDDAHEARTAVDAVAERHEAAVAAARGGAQAVEAAARAVADAGRLAELSREAATAGEEADLHWRVVEALRSGQAGVGAAQPGGAARPGGAAQPGGAARPGGAASDDDVTGRRRSVPAHGRERLRWLAVAAAVVVVAGVVGVVAGAAVVRAGQGSAGLALVLGAAAALAVAAVAAVAAMAALAAAAMWRPRRPGRPDAALRPSRAPAPAPASADPAARRPELEADEGSARGLALAAERRADAAAGARDELLATLRRRAALDGEGEHRTSLGVTPRGLLDRVGSDADVGAEGGAAAGCDLGDVWDDLVDVTRAVAWSEQAQSRLREAREATAQAAATAAHLAGELAAREQAAPSLAEAQERLTMARLELDRVESLATVLDITSAHLARAAASAHRDLAPRLAESVRRHLPVVTQGRYTDVLVDPATLDVRVLDLDGVWRDAALLSHGTAEQVYLLLRVALADHLVRPGTVVPVLLDDPLVHADPARALGLLTELVELAERRQVVLFTQQPEVRSWAQRSCRGPRHALVELPAPPSRPGQVATPPLAEARSRGERPEVPRRTGEMTHPGGSQVPSSASPAHRETLPR